VLQLAAGLAISAFLSAGSAASTGNRTSDDSAAFGDPAFCAPGDPVEDFGISQLPPVDEVPSEGDLPFGPKTLSLDLFGGPILPLGESFGFWLNSANYAGRTPLRWVLRNRLRPVDPSGAMGGVLAKGHVRVPMINAATEVKLFLQPPPKPGFYRYDIEIVDFDGNLLGSYSKYLRVERKFWRARLGLNRQTFKLGERVLSRVENLGTETVLYGEVFAIQRKKATGWTHVRDRSRDGWFAWLGTARAGMAGRCSALRLPDDFPPGRYRIVKEVGPHPWPEGKRSYHLTAPFQVIG
jgi:hypothetical protein